MIKLKNILLEDRLEAMKDRLKLSDDDVIYLKSLNVPDKYIIWLANQYKLNTKQHGSNERFKEDAYKYEEALQKFFELSTKNKIEDKNINNYKDIFALYDVIEKFDDVKSKRELEKDIKLKGAEKVYEDDKWLVVIPKTEEAACYYGKGTKWCTASTKKQNLFNHYNDQGPLYIFINKKDSNERYQLHQKTHQFMDIMDQRYDIYKFVSHNPSLYSTFLHILGLKYNKVTGRYDSDHSVNIRDEFMFIRNDNGFDIQFGHIDGDFDCSNLALQKLKGAPKTVNGNFNCSNNELETLKYAPMIVNGNFDCSYNELNTLKGATTKVGHHFNCEGNRLKTLKGSPETINGDFNCSDNDLISLQGAPNIVDGSFYCGNNELKTLKYSPQTVGGDFLCEFNQLKILEGAPKTVGGGFVCTYNQLKTLEGCPQTIDGNFDCSYNDLKTLKGAPQTVGGDFYCDNNLIEFTEDDVRKVSNVKEYILTK